MASFSTVTSTKIQGLPKLLEELEAGSFVVVEHQRKNFLVFNGEDFSVPFVFSTPQGNLVSIIPEAHMESLNLLLSHRRLVTDCEDDKAIRDETAVKPAGRRKIKAGSRRPKIAG
jgi:hypothetical protein